MKSAVTRTATSRPTARREVGQLHQLVGPSGLRIADCEQYHTNCHDGGRLTYPDPEDQACHDDLANRARERNNKSYERTKKPQNRDVEGWLMSEDPDGAVKQVTFFLTCTGVDSCSVVFEPLGAEYVLRSDDVFKVIMIGPASGEFEVSYSPGALTIADWPGADTKVWNRAGEKLLDLDAP